MTPCRVWNYRARKLADREALGDRERPRQQKLAGVGPTIEAAMKADAMLEKGDIDGQAAWLRILGAVKELLLAQPDKGDVVH